MYSEKTKLLVQRVLKIIIIVLAIIIILPFTLYIPQVQNFVKNIAEKEVSKALNLNISIDELHLRFPLNLELQKVVITDKNNLDTLIAAQNIAADISVIPLFKSKINVNTATFRDAVYNMTSADSSMILSTKAALCDIKDAIINLKSNVIILNEGFLKGGNVNIHFENDKTKPTPTDTTKSAPWIIEVGKIRIEDINYFMQMLPTIESINTHIKSGLLKKGLVDTGRNLVEVRYIGLDGVNAQYFTPPANYVSSIVATTDTLNTSSSGKNWIIKGGTVNLSNSSGLYAMKGHNPQKGLDLSYIKVDNFNFSVKNFYNEGSIVKVPLTLLSGKERCGIEITAASGNFEMADSKLIIENWNIATQNSFISCNSTIDMGVFSNDASSALDIKSTSSISPNDIKLLYPFTAKYISAIPYRTSVEANLDITGNMQNLNIKNIELTMPQYATIKASGNCKNLDSNRQRRAYIEISGNLNNMNWAKTPFLPANLQKEIMIPSLIVNGDIYLCGAETSGNLLIKTTSGAIKLDGSINGNIENYDVALNMNKFPINLIMPNLGVKDVTATLDASGEGFNPFNKNTHLYSELNIESLEFKNNIYDGISTRIEIADGNADVVFDSQNRFADLYAHINSSVINNNYEYTLDSEIRNIDFKNIGLIDSTCYIKGVFASSGIINTDNKLYDLRSNFTNVKAEYQDIDLNTDDINLSLYSTNDSTSFRYSENDAYLSFNTPSELNTFFKEVDKASNLIATQYKSYSLNFSVIDDYLPYYDLKVNLGNNNLVSQFMKNSDIGFKSFYLYSDKDSIITLDSKLIGLKIKETTLDTINISANEQGENLLYNIHIGNKRGNLNQFAKSDITGYIGSNKVDMMFVQHNIENQIGFNLGLIGERSDNKLRLSLYPDSLIIGYKNWTLNPDNYININLLNKHIDANLRLENNNSLVSLNSTHKNDSTQEDLMLNIKGIQIGEWLNMSPLSPPISGALNAKANISRENNNLLGNSNFSLSNFFYDKKNVGNIDFDLNMDVNPKTGFNEASASVSINGTKAILLKGAVNDTISNAPYSMTMLLNRLPLTVANPFLPSNMAQLSGYLNGEMSMKGTNDRPIFNGFIECDSSAIALPMFGSKLNFKDSKIRVDSSIVKLSKFILSGTNNKPLFINGKVNLKSLDNPEINLNILGERVQIIDSRKTNKSQIYGKGFVDINANINGYLSQLDINANISILEGTNATYVYQSNMSDITKQQVGDLVKFVQFNDTTGTVIKPSSSQSFSMNLNTNINILPGSTLNVDLSPSGKDQVQVGGSGNLSFFMTPFGGSRLIGRYTISSGFVRYSPPLISEKLFSFKQGSYISWIGDISNPTLNIEATDKQTATVIIDDESPTRVNFIIGAKVSNSLNKMVIAFDLSAENNTNVQSELQSMTADQRATQAMNLMLYNSYTGSMSSSATTPNTNMLYSFLSSQLNSWASKMVKGVDIYFGINEYNTSNTSNAATGMNYSYQISKTLFDNRFKMTVGGNYDTTNNISDNSIAQNLLNNISFEYALVPSGAMAIKIYSHLTDNNIFQSQVTETGGAFIIRRKIVSFKDLFKFNFKNIFTSAQSQK